jgi:hypothetical protein
MTVSTLDAPIFENEEWLVDDQGLEHKRTGYFIDRDAVPSRRPDGLWSWPVHMAEKTWCSMPAFMEAFSSAVAIYGISADLDLALSFRVARCEIADWPRSMQVRRAPHPDFRPPASRHDHCSGDRPITQSGDRERSYSMLGSLRVYAVARPRPGSSTSRARNLPWRARRSFRRAGSNIVRIIQAVWNMRSGT